MCAARSTDAGADGTRAERWRYFYIVPTEADSVPTEADSYAPFLGSSDARQVF
jgi:hypothetical protein